MHADPSGLDRCEHLAALADWAFGFWPFRPRVRAVRVSEARHSVRAHSQPGPRPIQRFRWRESCSPNRSRVPLQLFLGTTTSMRDKVSPAKASLRADSKSPFVVTR